MGQLLDFEYIILLWWFCMWIKKWSRQCCFMILNPWAKEPTILLFFHDNPVSQKEKMINDTALTIGKKSYSYLLPKNHTTKNKTLHYKWNKKKITNLLNVIRTFIRISTTSISNLFNIVWIIFKRFINFK